MIPFILPTALHIANEAHNLQKDKRGDHYILHPIRVMLAMPDELSMIVAILHDAVEDTEISLDYLRELGCPEMAVIAIDCLTKRPGEDYWSRIEIIKKNQIATRVKIADLEDNLQIIRIKNRSDLKPEDMKRLNKYYDAWTYLTGK